MKSYKAKHILLEEIEDAQYVLERLEAGDEFEYLAKEFSECDSSHDGGYLGRFPSGSMYADFERALYHMSIGDISKPVKTKYGFHIIWRLE